jgi:carnitine 3-dehydrogenase
MSETKTAAIIGGGVIGGGWAARFLLNGWDVVVTDPDPEVERKVGEVLANARRSLPALSDVTVPKEGRLSYAASIADAVAGVDWIQESAPERLDIKHVIFAEIQKHCRHDALIGSSTSGFKPSELQQGAARPEQIFVAHPFNPVYLLPVIELVGVEATLLRARDVLDGIGMKPLIVRKEIDAHIADRFLEAVWREALWLVKDGIATTQEIDDVIRYGFGMRWAQMGLFETYRIAGGEAGMRHFIAQFGPCLSWPWTKLMDVPELTDELTDMIADQSDAQSGMHSIRELERIRDDNLVAMMRALKGRNWGAGQLLNAQDARIKPPLPTAIDQPLADAQPRHSDRLDGLQRPHERKPLRTGVFRCRRRGDGNGRRRPGIYLWRPVLFHGLQRDRLSERDPSGRRDSCPHPGARSPRQEAPSLPRDDPQRG